MKIINPKPAPHKTTCINRTVKTPTQKIVVSIDNSNSANNYGLSQNENDCKPQKTIPNNQFPPISDFLAFIAIVISVLIYIRQERNKKKELLKLYKSKNKYFKLLVNSFIPYSLRQISEFKIFYEKTKNQPLSQNRLKIEFNNDYERLLKFDNNELYESLYYYNKNSQFSNDYRYVIYGVGIIYETVQRCKVIYEKYLFDTQKLQRQLLDIINDTKCILTTVNDSGLAKEFITPFIAQENEDNINEGQRFETINTFIKNLEDANETQKRLFSLSQKYLSYYFILKDIGTNAAMEFENITSNIESYVSAVEEKFNRLETE